MRASKIWGLVLTAALGVGMIGSAAPAVAIATGTLTVKVASASGQAFEGAFVAVSPSASVYDVKFAQTSSLGVATFKSLNYGTYTVEASVWIGSKQKEVSRTVTVGSSASSVTFNIKLSEISGVVTLKGTPVKNAMVTLSKKKASGLTSNTYAFTDSRGRYFFTGFVGGTYKVLAVQGSHVESGLPTYFGGTVRKPDAADFRATKATVKSDVNIALMPAAIVTGRVVSKSGKALARTSVYAQNTDRAGEGYGKTDKNGHFKIGGLATGKVEISLSGTNFVAMKQVSAKQGVTVSAGRVVLKSASVFTGQIRGTLVNRSPKDSITTVAFISTLKGGPLIYAELNESQDSYSAQSVPVGKYKVVLSGTNKVATTITVKKGKTTKVKKLTRAKGTTISGVVKGSNGNVVHNQYLHIFDSYGFYLGGTDVSAKGRYSIDGAISGKYTVYTSGTSKDLSKETIVKVAKGKSAKVNVKLKRGFTVEGVVRNSAGKPIVGVTVDSGSAGVAYTDAPGTSSSGKFTVAPVVKGAVHVTARDPFPGGYVDKTIKVKAPTSKAKITMGKR